MTVAETGPGRHPPRLASESWAYVCGLCVAREGAFIPPRFIEEMGTLSPAEFASRLSRTYVGTVDPLAAFDRVIEKRFNDELDEMIDLSPSSLPVDLVRVRPAADAMRRAVGGLAGRLDAAGFAEEMKALRLRAGDYADEFAALFEGPWPDPGDDARTAAALAIDSAELMLVEKIASTCDDAIVRTWAEYRVGEGAARVAARALKLKLARGLLAGYFFRGALLTSRAQNFLAEFNDAAALALYPSGVTPENVRGRLLEVTGASTGQPHSAGRVLHYLQLFADQIVRLRRAVFEATGRLRRGAA
jgi:hypothetical protein